MNWQHLKTFLWLRWRLRVNRNKRAGTASVWLQRLFLILGVTAAGAAFTMAFAVGVFALGKTSPAVLMLVWDGVVAAFLFIWLTELLVELQRSDLIGMDKLLHLPVSLNGAFLINYVGSIVSPALSVVVAGILGLSIGLLFSRGPWMFALFPLTAGFILMTTSIAYQFRGWLASLMVNKRRRRAIATIAGLLFVLILQIPNLVLQPWRTRQPPPEVQAEMQKEIATLDHALAAHEIDRQEYRRQSQAVRAKYRARSNASGWKLEDIAQVAAAVNRVVPFGWLPYGALTSAQRRIVPSILGALGLFLIAAASLRRSYATTLRFYRGEFSGGGAGGKRPQAHAARAVSAASAPPLFVEKKLPWISEQTAAVALASFRALTRAPEARILFLSPVLMVLVFGSMILRSNADPPELLRPVMAAGGMAMVLLVLSQLAGNQFGFDRNGFRVYVLSPAERGSILIGKNLALAPFALGLTAAMVVVFQFVYPMEVAHFAATLIQTVTMYFLYCLFENILSMIAPMPVAQGSLKPYKPTGMQLLIHFLFLLMSPVALSAALIPLAIEYLVNLLGFASFPAYLTFSIVECGLVLTLYPFVVRLQGDLLQQRERTILEVVAGRVD